MDILSISNLYKSFGNHKVLNGLNLSVPEGSIYGFIGKNGAGKTTTMKISLGLLEADSGEITICNSKVKFGSSVANQFVGYLPDVPEYYNFMTAKEYLKLCGEITDMSANLIQKKSEDLINLVGLSDVKKRIGTYSRGMKQRLGIAQALLNDPRLLICDEPTSALDPVGRKEILDILFKVKKHTTVIFSTHILSDVETICDHIGILNHGEIVLSGKLNDIKHQYQDNTVVLTLATNSDLKVFVRSEAIAKLDKKVDLEGNSIYIKTSQVEESMNMIMALLVKLSITPLKLEVVEPCLEDIFMEAIK
ncbi:ABC transporter ATP-binding protein [Clostridium omnivorum]|uniref:ABC transporter ATP-binding protein n=1 Tax=Clostridium omnivorum TaxID=1604902 RepID=A0ABQ5N1V9_9CLOT|nr:ABC transporter ATP-binding protein [Clostridium sp. E14]GLC29178.1 ABC transporter ATP-binding protein [Clostridium sp. E14]